MDEEIESIKNECFETIAVPVGHLLLEFNELEIDTGTLLARLLDQHDYVARILAGSLAYSARISLIGQFLESKIRPDQKNRMKAAVAEAEAVGEERNRFIHSEYIPRVGPNDKLLDLRLRKLRGGARKEFSVVSPREIEELSARAQKVGVELRTCAERHADVRRGEGRAF
ncbi:hypothetical protein JNW90_07550 [Micromonospora sp. STR1s_5]|nr:hypothetical protein [Micromonospora sp. STR1s_5]